MPYDYDLICIGSGPAGQRAAVQAAKLGKKVAIVERKEIVGGVCVNTGTIPSKTLREAILHFSGIQQRAFYGASYIVKDDLKIGDILGRCNMVITREIDVIRSQLHRNGIALLGGEASFTGPHELDIKSATGGVNHLDAEFIVIATGTTPSVPPNVTLDHDRLLSSDGILSLKFLPHSMTVVGGGVIGIEYASMFAALGTEVTIVDQRKVLLEFIDGEIRDDLIYQLREMGCTFRLGEEVAHVDLQAHGDHAHAVTHLKSGKQIMTDAVLFSAGRTGATGPLNLAAAGVSADARGRIKVDAEYRTAVPHIFAVGDVIGFPSLASASFEQGRLAAAHAFGMETRPMRELLPIGIYTIPEISFAGKTEEELTAKEIPYEIGISRYRELARGQILGDSIGILKLLVSAEDRTLLGVHVFGTSATELLHIGQTVMGLGGTVDYLIDQVFNYPTLAESYKVAALDATNKLQALGRMAGAPAVTAADA